MALPHHAFFGTCSASTQARNNHTKQPQTEAPEVLFQTMPFPSEETVSGTVCLGRGLCRVLKRSSGAHSCDSLTSGIQLLLMCSAPSLAGCPPPCTRWFPSYLHSKLCETQMQNGAEAWIVAPHLRQGQQSRACFCAL